MHPQARVLRTPEAAKYLGLAVSTLEKFRLTGEGPQFVRIGVRAVGYLTDDLEGWLRKRVRSSTSEGRKHLVDALDELAREGA
jgi:predicted DNA-binding transcriptional regulator AlpA